MITVDFGVIDITNSDELRVFSLHKFIIDMRASHNVTCDKVVIPNMNIMKGTLVGDEADIAKVVTRIKQQFSGITFVLSEPRI